MSRIPFLNRGVYHVVLKIATQRLIAHRNVWNTKPILKQLYVKWYQNMMSYTTPGRILEIGSGPGNLSELYPEVIATDIVFCPWLDLVTHASSLPFRKGSLQNIVIVDVLHHIANIVVFFEKLQRVLSPGGRIVMLEPYISPFSRLVFKLVHPEPVDLTIDPLCTRGKLFDDSDPFDSNQAIPTLLFWRDLKRFEATFPMLKVLHRERCAFLAYPLSGGFEHRNLVPSMVLSALQCFVEYISLFSRLLSFRCLCVLEYCSLTGIHHH